MSETIHEQIAQWIAAALDGKQDPDATMTLRAVRPKILDWSVNDFRHDDVIIEAGGDGNEKAITTESFTTNRTRTESAKWNIYGIVRKLPEDTVADTVVSRMIETIRRILLAGNVGGRACDGLAERIDCPSADFEIFTGGLIAYVEVNVRYQTTGFDGYSQE